MRGPYPEQVVLDAQHDGVSLYGGFSCSGSWKWTGDKPQVNGPSSLYALDVTGPTKAIAIHDISFSVPDATGQDATGAGKLEHRGASRTRQVR